MQDRQHVEGWPRRSTGAALEEPARLPGARCSSQHRPFGGHMMIVRFAPTTSGDWHIGSFRTYLANYLLARHYGGEIHVAWHESWKDLELCSRTEILLHGLGLQPDRTHLVDWWHGDILAPLLCPDTEPRHRHLRQARYRLRSRYQEFWPRARYVYPCRCPWIPAQGENHPHDPCRTRRYAPTGQDVWRMKHHDPDHQVCNPRVGVTWREGGEERWGWHTPAWHALHDHVVVGATHAVRGRDCVAVEACQRAVEALLGLPEMTSQMIGLVKDQYGAIHKRRDPRPLESWAGQYGRDALCTAIYRTLQPGGAATCLDDMAREFCLERIPPQDVHVNAIVELLGG